jgi:radical SAM protein with 4Fe4S-binding SPASM domain
MIAYAKKAGIKTVTSTNGMLLSQNGLARRLVESGLDSLIVAVDGLDEETQTKYRRKSRLSQVIEGIKQVVEARRELGAPHPLLNFRMVVNRYNESQLDDAENLARDLGMDMISFKTLNSYDTVNTDQKHLGTGFIPQNPDHARYTLDADTGQRKKVAHNPCRSLWNCPDIHWNGVVVPCCFDHHDDIVLGSLENQSFKDIWRGRAYAEMRSQFRRDWSGHLLCKDCSYSFVGGDLCEEAVRDARFFVPGLMA